MGISKRSVSFRQLVVSYPADTMLLSIETKMEPNVITMRTEVNESKFIELLVHAVNTLGDSPRGMATKLNKVLYFCDFAHVRRSGDPITGFEYQKLAQGPTPRAMMPIRNRLVEDGTLTFESTIDAFGYNHHVFSASRDADLTVFSPAELETIEAVTTEIANMSARQVSDLSHEDTGWQMVELGETIPFASAYLGAETELPERLRPAIEATAAELINELEHRLAR